MDCIFCKISTKEISSEIVFEDGTLIAFKDIHPSAPVHILIVPRTHIASVNDLREEDEVLVGKLIMRAKLLAHQQGIEKGYKLQFNVGKDGGQIVEHLHLHLLGGWNAISA